MEREDGFHIDSDGVLTEYTGGDRSVVVPMGVTSISEQVFEGRQDIECIIVPETLKVIKKSAFGGCTGIKSVEIPSSVTTIEDEAFSDCTNLEKVDLGTGLEVIGKEAFCNCISLKDIKIPESIKYIGDSAFCNCEELKVVDIPESVDHMGEGVFKGCMELGDENGFVIINNILYDYFNDQPEVEIPEGVAVISSYAFMDRKPFVKIHFPKVTNGECKDSLDSIYIIHTKERNSFKSVKSIRIPEGTTTIGMQAFDGCGGLESIELPKSMEKIAEWAFRDCDNLYKIHYPQGIPELKMCYDEKKGYLINLELYVRMYLYGDESHNPEFDDVCRKNIGKNTANFFKKAVKQGSVKAAERIVECCKRSNIGRLDSFINIARKNNSAEILAFLLWYKHRNYSIEEIEKYKEKKNKKIWGDFDN